RRVADESIGENSTTLAAAAAKSCFEQAKKLNPEFDIKPSDIDLIKLKEALTPDLSFLDPISEMGESIADMPASVRRAFAEKDSNLAEKAENETLKQWIPEFIESLQGKGYLSLNHGVLSVSFVDSRFLAIINEAAKIIFLSATDS
ncbi:MAG: hypothetical protein ACKO90_10905, partial [Microcystis panniformis]